MADQQNVANTGRDLRRRAEEKAKADEARSMEPLSPDQVREVLHELRVHQIELELQNAELQRTRDEVEAALERYTDLYDFAPAGYITVSDQGVIVEANRTAATLLNLVAETLVGQSFFRFILSVDQDIYYQHRAAIFETVEPQTCKLRLLRADLPPFWARLATAPVGRPIVIADIADNAGGGASSDSRTKAGRKKSTPATMAPRTPCISPATSCISSMP